jgi:tetratricopeptide (TPR) repeat protein
MQAWRTIVQVGVGVSVVIGTLAAADQTAQTPPPTSSSAASSQEAPAPPPRPALPLTPEQRAFQDANRIQDPAQKLDALRKLQADLSSSVATMVRRQVDEGILWHLVTQFRDRQDEIAAAFVQVTAGFTDTPEARLLSLPTVVNRLLDNKMVLPAAEKALVDALAAVTAPAKESSAAATPPTAMATGIFERSGRSAATRGRALETLGRLHEAMGQSDKAVAELKEALELSPTLPRAPAMLAELEVKRGNTAAALDHYLLAAVAGRLKSPEEVAMRALYRQLRGDDTGLEAELDRVYDKHFPNPVKSEQYKPSAESANRVVLLELFTGSACGPCVSADLAWDSVLARYPDTLIAPLAYHAHIPGPDPMVVPGGDGRRLYYQVKGVPTLHVNGALGKLGGGPRENAQRNYSDYIAMVDKALQTKPTAIVEVQASRSGSKINVTARVSDLPGVDNRRLHIVVAERHLTFTGENGIRHHAMVVRGVAGDKGGGLPMRGTEATFDFMFDLADMKADVATSLADEIARRRKTTASAATPPDYRAEGRAMGDINPEALVVVAFVQDGAKNVLQAARADVK